jgi:hypothetical protein
MPTSALVRPALPVVTSTSARPPPPAADVRPDHLPPLEFRLHKSIDNPIHIVGFLQQWKGYLEVLETQAAREGLTNGIRGKKMELGEYEKVRRRERVSSPCPRTVLTHRRSALIDPHSCRKR